MATVIDENAQQKTEKDGNFSKEDNDPRDSYFFLRKYFRYFSLVIPLLLVLFLYWGTIRGPFTFDDTTNIAENEYIQLKDITFKGLWDAGFSSVCRNRPVANITFALNYFFDGYDTTGYHLVNILIHMISLLLLYGFLVATLQLIRKSQGGLARQESASISLYAFFAVLVWSVHPLLTGAVSYVVQRMTSMSAMFYLLSMLLYVKARVSVKKTGKWLLYPGSAVSGLLAMGSKEIASTLPFFVFLYEWYFFQNLDRAWLKKNGIRILAAGGVFVVITLFYLGFQPLKTALSGYALREFTLSQRILTEFRVVIHYLTLLFYPNPSRLNLDYDFPLSYSLVSPVTTIFSLVGILGLFICAVYTAKKHRFFSFAILWLLGNLVIESSVIPLELVYEHRMYLPSMLMVSALVFLVLEYTKPRWVGIVALCSVTMLFAFWTYERNVVWSDDELLWQDCVKKSPRKMRTHNNYGLALAGKGRHEEALKEYRKAMEIHEDRYVMETHGNIGLSYLALERYDEAIEQFMEVIRVNPKERKAFFALGQAYEKKGMVSQAIEYYRFSSTLNPKILSTKYKIAELMASQGNGDEAVSELQGIIKAHPDDPISYLKLGNVYGKIGKYKDAVDALEKALKIMPEFSEAHTSIGMVSFQQGDFDAAVSHFQKAIKSDAKNENARLNLGLAFADQGRLIEAIEQFEAGAKLNPKNDEMASSLEAARKKKEKIDLALGGVLAALKKEPDRLDLKKQAGDLYKMEGDFGNASLCYENVLNREPGNVESLYGMAVLNSAFGNYDRALSYLEKFKDIQPDNPDVYYNIACVYARQKKTREAVEWLKSALGKGFRNWDLIRDDKDLNSIRDTEFYKTVMANR